MKPEEQHKTSKRESSASNTTNKNIADIVINRPEPEQVKDSLEDSKDGDVIKDTATVAEDIEVASDTSLKSESIAAEGIKDIKVNITEIKENATN